jgi:hypothetical protein
MADMEDEIFCGVENAAYAYYSELYRRKKKEQ